MNELMNETCDNCHLKVADLISVSGPGEFTYSINIGCFSCVYEKVWAIRTSENDQKPSASSSSSSMPFFNLKL
jgi:hypothetical protein